MNPEVRGLIVKREDGSEMNPGVNKIVRVYVATKRKIEAGIEKAEAARRKGK